MKPPRTVMYGEPTEEFMDALEDVLFNALLQRMDNDYEAALAEWNAIANDPDRKAQLQEAVEALTLTTDPSLIEGKAVVLSCGCDDAFKEDTAIEVSVH